MPLLIVLFNTCPVPLRFILPYSQRLANQQISPTANRGIYVDLVTYPERINNICREDPVMLPLSQLNGHVNIET